MTTSSPSQTHAGGMELGQRLCLPRPHTDDLCLTISQDLGDNCWLLQSGADRWLFEINGSQATLYPAVTVREIIANDGLEAQLDEEGEAVVEVCGQHLLAQRQAVGDITGLVEETELALFDLSHGPAHSGATPRWLRKGAWLVSPSEELAYQQREDTWQLARHQAGQGPANRLVLGLIIALPTALLMGCAWRLITLLS